MICDRCKMEISDDDDSFNHYGKTLCEDCYVAALEPPKPCDPTAVSSALSTRRQLGQKGTEGLTDLQKNIYNFIKEKGKATREEIIESINIPQWELEKQIAVLRHCELTKGFKEGDKVYLTLWEN